MLTRDKERLREGEEISPTEKTERREINQQVKRLMEQGVGPKDVFQLPERRLEEGEV